jgi:preprotein translocase subunit SecG
MSTVITTIVGILLILVAIFLVVAVLMQSAKNSRMSGVVSGGGAETFFGKYKGKTVDKTLNRWTIVIGVVFVATVLALYIIQPGKGKVNYGDSDQYLDAAMSAAVTTTADSDDEGANPTTDAVSTTEADEN